MPGGGAALFAGSCLLEEKLKCATDRDERAALNILIRILREPARVILENAVSDAAPALSALARSREGYGYDVQKGQAVKMLDAGIIDSLEVQKMALQTAVQTSALALTSAAFVYRN